MTIAPTDPRSSAQETSNTAATQDVHRFFFTHALDMLCIAGFDGYFKELNPLWGRVLGYTQEELLAEPFLSFVHPDDQAATIFEAQKLADIGVDTVSFENRYRCKNGSYRRLRWASTPDRVRGLIYAIARDVTQEHENALALQEEIIRAQQAALEELSTPLIPISDQVMVMPLIGTMDTRRAQQVMDSLLQGIATSGANTAILDITGVSVVDTQVANALVRASQAVKLLGARVILTGIRPEVAQTLVSLGVDLRGIITCGTLQSGISLALQRHERS